MEEQVEYRLSTWKVKYFSHGGKITLIESALSIFFFHFYVPFQMSTSIHQAHRKIGESSFW